jgi:hypothetical protein
MTLQRCILGGDKKGIWLTNNGQQLSFDITIPTSKGILFAMCIRRDTEIVGATADAGPTIPMQ